jgi:hypothetical protein
MLRTQILEAALFLDPFQRGISSRKLGGFYFCMSRAKRAMFGGRPVPIIFYPDYVPIAGSLTAGLLLSYLIVIANQEWVEVNCEELQETMQMTRSQLDTARRNLRQRGLLNEVRKHLPATLFMRINPEGTP